MNAGTAGHASPRRKIAPIYWDIARCAFLGIVFWVARYWYFKGFGLYEDDLTIVPRAVTMSFSDVLNYIGSYITHMYGHGRPLSDSMIYLFSNVGYRLDGLLSIYLIGYAITLVNIILFYLLVRRVANTSIALIAGLFYVLYSADTTQVFLTHSLGAQPSILLVLLAFHAYLSKRKVLAYILAAIILFSYESPFLVFLGAPLLEKVWGRPMIKKFILHAVILLGMVLAIFIFRSSIGEGRVSGLTTQQLLTSPITHSLIGPVVSLGTYLLRPYQALRAADATMIAAFIISGVVILVALYLLQWKTRIDVREFLATLRTRSRWSQVPEEMQRLGELFLAGLVMLVGAYPLTFTVRAYAISGRDTRVHLAGVMGAAIVVACVVAFLYSLVQQRKAWWALSVVIAVWAASLVSYGFMVQEDYTLGWQFQRQFWTAMVQLVPDAGPDSVILVTPDGLPDVRQIGANTWNLPRVLDQLYSMPAEWKNPPRVFRLVDGWEQHIVGADGNFVLDATTVTAPSSLYGEVVTSQVIFIDSGTGSLVRRDQPLSIGNQSYPLQANGSPVLTGLRHGWLYSMLVEDSRLEVR